MKKTIPALLFGLLLPSVRSARTRRCYYMHYPPTRPGEYLTGPTHTCRCTSSGRWTACTKNTPSSTSTIVDVAVAGGFDTLVAAVKAADLVDALSGSGPFTVFAPTDEAFAALPSGVLNDLLDDTEALSEILLYHVVSGKVKANNIPNRLEAATLNGEDILLQNRGGSVTVNDIEVTTADVSASNGVIHVIDQVLIPPSPSESSDSRETSRDQLAGHIVDVAVAAGFDTLVTAVTEANLVGALSGEGPFTVFAPTNDAFAALPEGVLTELLSNPDALSQVLLYHVVSGQVEADDIPDRLNADTLNGQAIVIRALGDDVSVNGADVVTADVFASNGVIHVIDRVLLPRGTLKSLIQPGIFPTCQI